VNILGIETSCDETAAAVVRDGRQILSSVVASQDDLHGRFGGIVPELASRRHVATILEVIELALQRAELTLDQIDGIAVTKGPGLIGSLLVGLSVAKAIGFSRKIASSHMLSKFWNSCVNGARPARPATVGMTPSASSHHQRRSSTKWYSHQ